MKTFEEILKDNGVEIPRYFEKDWSSAVIEYDKLRKVWMDKNVCWDTKKAIFEVNWGEENPNLQEELPNLQEPELHFKNLDECLEQIERAKKELNVVILKLGDSIEMKLKEKWLSKILKNMPEGCRKIIIYTDISIEALHALNKTRQGEVRMNGIGVQGIAFDPKNLPSVEFWLMNPHNAKVEYVK